jgi:hypothetical protein
MVVIDSVRIGMNGAAIAGAFSNSYGDRRLTLWPQDSLHHRAFAHFRSRATNSQRASDKPVQGGDW